MEHGHEHHQEARSSSNVSISESHSSSNTRSMNTVLKDILRTTASEIRGILDGGGSIMRRKAQRGEDERDLRVLCIHWEPSKKFDWQWRDKDNEFHRKGTMTPLEFVDEYVEVDWEEYICIVNDPRNEYYRTYTVDFLQNVAGGPPVVYLNVPSDEMKALTQRL